MRYPPEDLESLGGGDIMRLKSDAGLSPVLATLSRRRALMGLGAASSFLALGLRPRRVLAQPSFASDPLTMGVASGDPDAQSVVLWTRLAPDPLHGGGMPDAAARMAPPAISQPCPPCRRVTR